MTVYNFSAGPATLPDPVLKQIHDEFYSLNGSGMSILEISHRSALFQKIMDEAIQNVKDLMNVPEGYSVIFSQGGGTGQFAAVPLNLANQKHRIAFLDSGHWSDTAIDEAESLGYGVDVVASTKDQHFQELPFPKQTVNADQYDYLYATINNTIEGTTFHQSAINDLKKQGLPLVGDMSSNFMAEKYNVSDFGLIYAGAQKNVGPAGVTIVIVKDELIHPREHTPKMMNYLPYIKKESMFNTPPVFAIYACNLVLRWIKANGGVEQMQKNNQAKSKLVYDYLDQSKLFHNHVKPADRSYENIVFTTDNPELDAKFVKFADERNLKNLKGHRTVGGMRASLYNAMPMAGAQALINCLTEFEAQH